jgi:hypothetical protein
MSLTICPGYVPARDRCQWRRQVDCTPRGCSCAAPDVECVELHEVIDVPAFPSLAWRQQATEAVFDWRWFCRTKTDIYCSLAIRREWRSSRRSGLLHDHQAVAGRVAKPEHRRHGGTHARDLGVNIYAKRLELRVRCADVLSVQRLYRHFPPADRPPLSGSPIHRNVCSLPNPMDS